MDASPGTMSSVDDSSDDSSGDESDNESASGDDATGTVDSCGTNHVAASLCLQMKRFDHGDTVPQAVLESMVRLTCTNMWLYAKCESVSRESYSPPCSD
jgi:hypothetical protein